MNHLPEILPRIDVLSLIKNFVSNLQFVNDYGLIGVMFVHMTPSFLFLMEGIDSAAVIGGLNPFAIVVFAIIGGTIGDFLWYYAGMYSYRKLKKIENKKEVDFIHRHRKYAWLYVAFPGGELLMIYAGIKHIKPKKILPFVIASNAIRSSLAVGVTTGIITFLPEIIKQIIF